MFEQFFDAVDVVCMECPLSGQSCDSCPERQTCNDATDEAGKDCPMSGKNCDSCPVRQKSDELRAVPSEDGTSGQERQKGDGVRVRQGEGNTPFETAGDIVCSVCGKRPVCNSCPLGITRATKKA